MRRGLLVLVAGVWAGEAALLPAARLAVFAPAVLWLLAPIASSPLARRLPRLLPPVLAYLALAGLPLTVGFGVLSRLYATWLPGGWVLLVVVAALLSVWLAVVYQSGRATAVEAGPAAGDRTLWLGAVPAALAARPRRRDRARLGCIRACAGQSGLRASLPRARRHRRASRFPDPLRIRQRRLGESEHER